MRAPAASRLFQNSAGKQLPEGVAALLIKYGLTKWNEYAWEKDGLKQSVVRGGWEAGQTIFARAKKSLVNFLVHDFWLICGTVARRPKSKNFVHVAHTPRVRTWKLCGRTVCRLSKKRSWPWLTHTTTATTTATTINCSCCPTCCCCHCASSEVVNSASVRVCMFVRHICLDVGARRFISLSPSLPLPFLSLTLCAIWQ